MTVTSDSTFEGTVFIALAIFPCKTSAKVCFERHSFPSESFGLGSAFSIVLWEGLVFILASFFTLPGILSPQSAVPAVRDVGRGMLSAKDTLIKI
jgi:hypothetical protein